MLIWRRRSAKGGHGYSKHVAKTAGYLKAYVIAWNMNPINELHPAEGSFHSLGEANNLVAAALRANPDVVQAAIDGGKNLRILHRFGYDTGYEAYQPSVQVPPIIRTTYWVEIYITNDPWSGGKGYRVVTAYPMNEIPNETTRKHMELMEF
ncbi:RNase A-like domain-containing protein [Devosia sp. UYZn731]|uniref:RNase A-like domain-containing protein n=1 Tax=Devosia sp. UYZn731 TaxID=3156345 RepID=UPI00339A9137